MDALTELPGYGHSTTSSTALDGLFDVNESTCPSPAGSATEQPRDVAREHYESLAGGVLDITPSGSLIPAVIASSPSSKIRRDQNPQTTDSGLSPTLSGELLAMELDYEAAYPRLRQNLTPDQLKALFCPNQVDKLSHIPHDVTKRYHLPSHLSGWYCVTGPQIT
jgi:hypothetical protein